MKLIITLVCTLAIAAAVTVSILGPKAGGAIIAVIAGGYLVVELVRAVRADRRVRLRRGRDAVWQRRIATREASERYL
jgi:Flp pilus assembly protein TadB